MSDPNERLFSSLWLAQETEEQKLQFEVGMTVSRSTKESVQLNSLIRTPHDGSCKNETGDVSDGFKDLPHYFK